MKQRIAVFGGAIKHDPIAIELAQNIGIKIAKAGYTMVTGATSGLPHFAAKACLNEGGFVLGVSPAADAQEHVERYKRPLDGCSEIFWTGAGFTIRNAINSKNCDAAIIVGGEIGTLQEFSAAFADGKIIGVLTSSGGITRLLKGVVEVCTNRYGANVIFSDSPDELLNQVFKLLQS